MYNRENAVHELGVIRTRLEYKGVIQSWITSDRQLPLQDREGPRTRGRAVYKANVMDICFKGNY